jgi:hypothetical protein
MGLDNEKSSVAESSSDITRRKFLVKGSATALIASLPIKTSWAQNAGGCMVSGTLSGNQSAVCDSVSVEGFSPDKWLGDAQADSTLKEQLEDIDWFTVFAGYPDRTYPNNPHLYNFYHMLRIELNPRGNPRGGSQRDRHLIAGYLNAYTGKYPLAAGVSPENYARYLEEEANKPSRKAALIAALQATYTS